MSLKMTTRVINITDLCRLIGEQFDMFIRQLCYHGIQSGFDSFLREIPLPKYQLRRRCQSKEKCISSSSLSIVIHNLGIGFFEVALDVKFANTKRF